MKQAEHDSKAPLPGSPYVDSDNPANTLDQCAAVLEFLADAIPSLIRDQRESVSEESGYGISWILGGVHAALQYESSRVKAQPSQATTDDLAGNRPTVIGGSHAAS